MPYIELLPLVLYYMDTLTEQNPLLSKMAIEPSVLFFSKTRFFLAVCLFLNIQVVPNFLL